MTFSSIKKYLAAMVNAIKHMPACPGLINRGSFQFEKLFTPE
jgi:hypothetical protein